mmetsp:Transcript_76366/g.198565  ORF Transcript_76366/g.198565 Transcript_76366/m.198565 type:complete len:103 (-) Transcript_76366:621-929(-)
MLGAPVLLATGSVVRSLCGALPNRADVRWLYQSKCFCWLLLPVAAVVCLVGVVAAVGKVMQRSQNYWLQRLSGPQLPMLQPRQQRQLQRVHHLLLLQERVAE